MLNSLIGRGLFPALLASTALIPSMVQAQDVTFTLSNVVFGDGATATGSFDYDFATNTYGPFDITTTDGVTGLYNAPPLLGYHYASTDGSEGYYRNGSTFDIMSTVSGYQLVLTAAYTPVSPGMYALQPGYFSFPDDIAGSGEYTNYNPPLPATTDRYITSGFLVANGPVPPFGPAVPEASTMISLGLLLLGLSGAAFAARKKSQLSAS